MSYTRPLANMTKPIVLLAFEEDGDRETLWSTFAQFDSQFHYEVTTTSQAMELVSAREYGAVLWILHDQSSPVEKDIAPDSRIVCLLVADVTESFIRVVLPLLVERNALVEELSYVKRNFEQRDLDKEISRLLSWYYRTTVTAETFGCEGIKEAAPQKFDRFVEIFSELIERNLNERTYKIASTSRLTLHDLSQQLGLLNAGPRDIIELYGASLRNKLSAVGQSRGRAYMESSRILVLELMGYMVSHYRNLSRLAMRSGIKQSPEERTP